MTSAENTGAGTPDLEAELAQLWQKFLPQLEERVAVLERAAGELSGGPISAQLRAEAYTAAHKLAGSLGIFGLTSGSALAREAESIFEDIPDAKNAAHLTEIAARLRASVASRS